MKISKLSNGRVLLLNNDGTISNSIDPSWSLSTAGTIVGSNVIYASSGSSNSQAVINADKVTATILEGVETAFSGDVYDLMDILSTDFFYKPSSGGEGDTIPVGTDKQVLGYSSGTATPVTLGLKQLSDVTGIPSFSNGVYTFTAINQTTGEALRTFIEFSTTTPKAGTFPSYITGGVLPVNNGVADSDAVNLGQLKGIVTVNSTTTALTSANLNSTYPSVLVGHRVICKDISGGGLIYTKVTENGSSDVWVSNAITTVV